MRDESIALGNLGWALLNQGRLDEALIHLTQKLELATKMIDKQEIGKALGNISTVYLAQEQYDKALEILNELLTLNQELGDEEEIHGVKELIAEIQQAMD
jgi:tetratricopeptide (TPR) repeat protein